MSEPVVIEGRPDFRDRSFGHSRAKRFPRYVDSSGTLGCLMHKVLRVELVWYDVIDGGNNLVWLSTPRAIAVTVGHGIACAAPRPDSVLCGRCHGTGSTFPRGGDAYNYAMRRAAHRRLGCIAEGVPA